MNLRYQPTPDQSRILDRLSADLEQGYLSRQRLAAEAVLRDKPAKATYRETAWLSMTPSSGLQAQSNSVRN